MSRFAVKIGEVQLRSNKPITDEQRKEALAIFNQNLQGDIVAVTVGGLDIVLWLTVDGH